MSIATASPRTPYVQRLIDSRPPSLTWTRPSPIQSNQPPLDLIDHEHNHAEASLPNDRGVRLSMVKARWAARPRQGLPDAQEWSARLALVVIQTMLGQRPVAQLNRRKYALAMSGLDRDVNLRSSVGQGQSRQRRLRAQEVAFRLQLVRPCPPPSGATP